MPLSNYWLFLCLSWSNQVNVYLTASCFCLRGSGWVQEGAAWCRFQLYALARKRKQYRCSLGCWTFSDLSDSSSKGQWPCRYGEEAVWNLFKQAVLVWIVLWWQFLMWHDKEIHVHYKWSLFTLFYKHVGHCCNPSLENYSTVQLPSLSESMVDLLQSHFHPFYSLME